MWLSIIPLTRHWLAIPKGPLYTECTHNKEIFSMKRLNKPIEFWNWIVQNSEKNKHIVLCATISIKSELTVLFTAWSRWWNILRRMMIFDIWNSYIYDEVRDEIKRSSRQRTLLKRVVENRTRKKLKSVRDLNPWPLQYRCSALLIELTSQLGTGSK